MFSNSPDLNPVDYSIWGAIQQLVYCFRRIRDVEHLKEVLQTCWEQIGQGFIDRAIRQFRKRLSLVATTGEFGRIEHRFDYSWCYTYILACSVVEIQNLDDKSKLPGLFCATLYMGLLSWTPNVDHCNMTIQRFPNFSAPRIKPSASYPLLLQVKN